MTTSKDNYNINFTGLTHDHFQPDSQPNNQTSRREQTTRRRSSIRSDSRDSTHSQEPQYCSVIGILRRHPMYDCLMLVKKYRNCLGGYSLEFPVDKMLPEEIQAADDIQQVDDNENENENTNNNNKNKNNKKPECNQRRLVSRYLDGDDPMHHLLGLECQSATCCSTAPTSGELQAGEEPFLEQVDDRGDHCELVHVPINGLLDRLDGYTRNQVAVDSRVYSFAMGLKTAERIMTTKSMKELQETPI